jgi:hypothetical protein
MGWDGISINERKPCKGFRAVLDDAQVCLDVPFVVFVIPNSPSVAAQKKDGTATCDRFPMRAVMTQRLTIPRLRKHRVKTSKKLVVPIRGKSMCVVSLDT